MKEWSSRFGHFFGRSKVEIPVLRHVGRGVIVRAAMEIFPPDRASPLGFNSMEQQSTRWHSPIQTPGRRPRFERRFRAGLLAVTAVRRAACRGEMAMRARLVWNRDDMSRGSFFTVTQLADELGLTPRAIRFYEEKGLISPQRAGNTRVYTDRERARLSLVQRGKQLGFSLQEIKDYLDLYECDTDGRENLGALLRGVRDRIESLELQSAALTLTLEELRDIERETVKSLEALERCGTG